MHRFHDIVYKHSTMLWKYEWLKQKYTGVYHLPTDLNPIRATLLCLAGMMVQRLCLQNLNSQEKRIYVSFQTIVMDYFPLIAEIQ